MSFLVMTVVPKKLFALCLVLAFVVGTTIQMMPPSMTQATRLHQSTIAAGPADPGSPCPAQQPTCVAHIGCLTVSAVPVVMVPMPTPFRWTEVVFEFAAPLLHGIVVEPELSPPILSA
jgi:hypothetical protein